ncbi:AAEL006120-PA, partial [Aedes aegypti]
GSDSNKGKSKKWRKILQFPHISQCIDLKNKIDVSYGYVVDQQPIGRELFFQFCKVKRPQYYRYISFLEDTTRYEIAADEIRVELAYNVAKRYLGLCADGHATEDTGGGGRGDDGDDGKCDDDSGIGGDTKKLSNHDDPAAEKKSLAGSNSLTNSNAVVAGKGTANNANNSSSNNAIKKCSGDDEDDDNDEFVLDILNDDIVAQVRSKLLNGSKELFEASVTAVKTFLQGEPFREFESSMYFHR